MSHSLGTAFGEIRKCAKVLIQSELELARAETKDLAAQVGRSSVRALVFGSLVSVSILPFFAFLIIAIGDLLGGKFWLSSLIVGLLCSLTSGALALKAYHKIKDQDLTLPVTRDALKQSAEALGRPFKIQVRDRINPIQENEKRKAA